MKTIILLRHAKSSWKFPELKDSDRPLNKRGLKDAPLMGKVLKSLQITPDLIITSPAVRAMTTANMIAQEFDFKENQILVKPSLYLESKSEILKEINKIDDLYNTVFLVSHNPGLTDLANDLSGESIDNIPTAGAMAIQFDCNSWTEVEKSKSKKMFFEIPKAHRKKIEKTKKQIL
ncbi:MAG: SixA phosphatase family protein [Bacteroidia bacterium]